MGLTGGDITKYRAFVTRISYVSLERPDLKFASMQESGAMANPPVLDVSVGRYLAKNSRAKCWFRCHQSGELETCSDVDWEGDKATRRSVSAGAIMSGGHCLKVWTKNSKGCRCPPPRERTVRRSQNRIRRAGDPERGKGLGDSMCAESTSGCLSDDVLGQPQMGKAKHVDMQNLWIHPNNAGSSRRWSARA